MKIREYGPGRWRLTWELGRDPAGKRRQKTQVVTAKTRSEAEKKWIKEQAHIDAGERDPQRRTVNDLLDAWYASGSLSWRPATRESYELTLTRFIRPALGREVLDALNPRKVQVAFDQWRQAPRVDGKPGTVGPSTAAYALRLLRQALTQGMKWQWVGQNAAMAVDKPPLPRPTRLWWDATTAAAFLNATVDDFYWIAWALALTTGMRQGEILGLRWIDIDWRAGSLVVEQIRSHKAQATFGKPKTARAARVVPLDADVVALLAVQQARQRALQHTLGSDYQDYGLVVATHNGTPVGPRNLVRAFKAAIVRAGVREIRFHDLRHTHASLLLDGGTNLRVIADRLGHAQATFTAQTYAHAGLDAQREAAALLSRRLLPTAQATQGEAGGGP